MYLCLFKVFAPNNLLSIGKAEGSVHSWLSFLSLPARQHMSSRTGSLTVQGCRTNYSMQCLTRQQEEVSRRRHVHGGLDLKCWALRLGGGRDGGCLVSVWRGQAAPCSAGPQLLGWEGGWDTGVLTGARERKHSDPRALGSTGCSSVSLRLGG